MKTTTVYLLHFSGTLGNERHSARHYIGSAIDLDARLQEHTDGQGARITAAARDRGFELACVRTWKGGRQLERRLKRQKKASRLCPVCRAAQAERAG